MDRLSSKDIQELWRELELDLELHQQLIESQQRTHHKTHLWQQSRPRAMELYDRAFHDSHGQRIAEIKAFRERGGKSIGTFCIYVPDELAHAVGVLPIPLCGGSRWAVDYADRALPRDICPLIRSTFGMAFSSTCPYAKLKEYPLGETTCDAKKKVWDLFGIRALEVPQRKEEIDRELWLSETKRFGRSMEELSGKKLTSENLSRAIRLMNDKRRVLLGIDEYRKLDHPPISGLDALLVAQTALSMDVQDFIDAGEALLEELEERTSQGVGAYTDEGPRVLMAGSPSPMGHSKVHYVAESSGMRVVADESCTGMRYYRDLVPEGLSDLDEMIEAVADRYFRIDCACFSPNAERVENVARIIEEFRVDGVIHNVLQYCHGYNIEAGMLDSMLEKKGIPSIKIVSDYSAEDEEQMRIRLETFSEILTKSLQ